MKPLDGRIALVAGATRGGGRGIARMLGEAGATVYCTGRSSRTQPNTSTHHYAGRPETIEETAEMVTAAGGVGIPVRVDHNVEAEVASLFKRIAREQKRLDVLVNILTGRPVASWSSFWKQPLDEGRAFVDSWLWSHLTTSWHAASLMVKRKAGLIVEVVEQPGIGYHGQFFFDLMESSLKRFCVRSRRRAGPAQGGGALGHTGVHAYRSDSGRVRRHRGELARRDRSSPGQGLRLGRFGNAVLSRPGRCGAGRRSERPQEVRRPVRVVGARGRVRLHGHRRWAPALGTLRQRALPAIFRRQIDDTVTNGGWWRRPASDRCARGGESMTARQASCSGQRRGKPLYSASMNGYL